MGTSLIAMETADQSNNNNAQPAAILVTKDDQRIDLCNHDLNVLKLSRTIKHMLKIQENSSEIPLFITTNDFYAIKPLLELLYQHKNNQLIDQLKTEYPLSDLLHYIELANFLDIPQLFDHCIQVYAEKLTDKTENHYLDSFKQDPKILYQLTELPVEISNALACQIMECKCEVIRTILNKVFPLSTCLKNPSQLISSIAISNNKEITALGCSKGVYLSFKGSQLKELYRLKNSFSKIGFTENNQLIIVFDDGTIFKYHIHMDHGQTFLIQQCNIKDNNWKKLFALDEIFLIQNLYQQAYRNLYQASFTFSSDGELTVDVDDATAKVNICTTFNNIPLCIQQINIFSIHSLALSIDNQVLAIGCTEFTYIFDLENFNMIKKLITKNLLLEQALLLAVMFSDEQPFNLTNYPHLLDIFNRLDPELIKILKKINK